MPYNFITCFSATGGNNLVLQCKAIRIYYTFGTLLHVTVHIKDAISSFFHILFEVA